MLIPYWSMHLVKKLILVAVKMQVSFKPGLNANIIPEISKNPNFRNLVRVIWFVTQNKSEFREMRSGTDFLTQSGMAW